MSIVLIAMLAISVVSVVAPMASAHTCTSEDPANECGSCRSGTHRHTYSNGTTYCSSSCGLTDIWCLIDIGSG